VEFIAPESTQFNNNHPTAEPRVSHSYLKQKTALRI